MDAPAVKKQIEAAWANVPYPGDENLRDGSSLEGQEVADFLRGKRWKDVTLTSLQSEYVGDGSACLGFLSPAAFRYYLPAYMLIAVDHYYNADVIADSAWSSLNPSYPEGTEMWLWWHERVCEFSSEQIRAIVGFLRFLDAAYGEAYPLQGPKDAISFWVAKL
jgi:hypothetical protein